MPVPRGIPLHRTLLDLLLVSLGVLWYYWPFLTPGIPEGDFASDVMVGEANRTVVTHLFSLPVWIPDLMCGRPTLDYVSPFHLLVAPFLGLEPVVRMKAVTLLYHVIAGLTMYALLRASLAGADAALFGGLVYPVMTSHVSRTAIQGHVHVVMFYALLPLIFLVLHRLRRRAWRAAIALSLVMALCLIRDRQRTLLVVIVVGLALASTTLPAAFRAARLRSPIHLRRPLWTLGLFGGAFVLAVGILAFELVNEYLGDPYRAGWRPGEQQYWIDRWSLDNLYTLVDRDGWLGGRLARVSEEFRVSTSRYVGLSLLGLVLYGALDPRALGGHRRRFWFSLLCFGLATWLSFGEVPPLEHLLRRWPSLLASAEVSRNLRAGLVVALATGLALGVAVAARNLPLRRPWAAGAALFTGLLLLFLLVAPLPGLRRLVFFLGEFRNPDWFGVALFSFTIAYPAALAVAALRRRLPARAYTAGRVALLALSLADFYPYRRFLDENQRSEKAIATLKEANRIIAQDPGEFRVLSAETYANLTDLGYIWHRKPLAWDFRGYSAPRRTGEYFSTVHRLFQQPGSAHVGLDLAGLANVKYVTDIPGLAQDLMPNQKNLARRYLSTRVAVYENLSLRPYLQAYPEARLFSEPASRASLSLLVLLARRGVGLASADDPAQTRLLEQDIRAHQARVGREAATAVASSEAKQGLQKLPSGAFLQEPVLSRTRPTPEHIQVTVRSREPLFLVVAESYHPWWRAELDGAPHRLYRGGYAFLGSFLPAGDHVLDLIVQRPREQYLWGVVSLACLTGSLGALILGVTRRRRRQRLEGPASASRRAAAPGPGRPPRACPSTSGSARPPPRGPRRDRA